MRFYTPILLMAIGFCTAQSPEDVMGQAVKESGNTDESIHNISGIEVKPEFPGGIQAFYAFIGQFYKTPEVPGLNGKIFASFVIEKDGSIQEVKILRDIGYGTGEEAARVLKLSPNWSPGRQNGQNVRVQFVLPINIQTPGKRNVETFSFDETDVKPAYPGGIPAFIEMLRKDHSPDYKGMVRVAFIVEKDGSLSDIAAMRDNGASDPEIDTRIRKSMPWTPGEKDGKRIRVSCIFPVVLKEQP